MPYSNGLDLTNFCDFKDYFIKRGDFKNDYRNQENTQGYTDILR